VSSRGGFAGEVADGVFKGISANGGMSRETRKKEKETGEDSQ